MRNIIPDHPTDIKLIAEDIATLPENILDHWQQRWDKNAAKLLQELRGHPPSCNSSMATENGWPTNTDKLMDVWAACHPLLWISEDTQTCLEALAKLIPTINLKGGSPSG
jgi:hypothetical protein